MPREDFVYFRECERTPRILIKSGTYLPVHRAFLIKLVLVIIFNYHDCHKIYHYGPMYIIWVVGLCTSY